MTSVTLDALTFIRGSQIETGCIIFTRLRQTFINVNVTKRSSKSRSAIAIEATIVIDTDAIFAGLLFTFVNIFFAKYPLVAGVALAGIVCESIYAVTFFTRVIFAKVDAFLAECTSKARWTGTFVIVDEIYAHMAFGTTVLHTVVNVDFAVKP